VTKESGEKNLKAKFLIYNAKIYTQADGLVVNSMAVNKNRIVAIGNSLNRDPDFKSYSQIDLKGKTVVPGFVDAHTHIYYYALSLNRLSLNATDSLDSCLEKISKFAKKLDKNEWVFGEGYSPELLKKSGAFDCYLLDKFTHGRPAIVMSKDQHSAWANSKALEIAGICSASKNPSGGVIERDSHRNPTGILLEKPAYSIVSNNIPQPSDKSKTKCYNDVLKIAYEKGVTGVHSFDDVKGEFKFFESMNAKKKLGLRINYYFPARFLPELIEKKVYFGQGDDFLRVAGIKIFSDGALGSQTALCYNKYIGSRNNFGIEVESVKRMSKQIKLANKLGLPSAIHAIGDKAVSNVIEAMEQNIKLHFGARHRIEHLQLIRRKDIARLKKLGAIASMQPSHCPQDIANIRKLWGNRGANAFVFRTLLDKKIPLAFGSDVPIEPLDPLGGISDAVTRSLPNSRDIFYKEQRITALEALYQFTVGSAYAVGQEHCRGYLLENYPADFVILSDDIGKTPISKIRDIKVLATFIDGKPKYSHSSLKL